MTRAISRDFGRVYASEGRPSIPPERLVRASALQVLYSIRSEQLPCELLDHNLLFSWFVGLSADEAIWDHSPLTENRERLIEAKVARKLLRRVVRKARQARLLSNEHFRMDRRLIESRSAKCRGIASTCSLFGRSRPTKRGVIATKFAAMVLATSAVRAGPAAIRVVAIAKFGEEIDTARRGAGRELWAT